MKNPLAPAGIEPATFRFVAQHLNHCATAVPESLLYASKKCSFNLTATEGTDKHLLMADTNSENNTK